MYISQTVFLERRLSMKAAVWHGAKDIRVKDVDLKPLQDNEVTVKVAWTGICGTDLHEYLEGPVYVPTEGPDPLLGGQAPITLGHEFAGVIERIGKKVTNYQVGDHVAINPTVTNADRPSDIDVYSGYSFIGLASDGGFASHANIPEDNLVRLPKNFPLRLGAVIEPAAVAVQAIKRNGLTFGQNVAIFGAGPIGCLVAAAAKAAGANRIIICDLSPQRLAKALELGATDTINSGEQDPVQRIKELVPGGVDASFEVAGVQVTFNQAILATKPLGTMTLVSIFGHPIEFNPMILTNTGVKITSTIAYSQATFLETAELITKGSLQVEPVITKEIPLDDIVTDGFEALTTDKSQAKILVNLDGLNN